MKNYLVCGYSAVGKSHTDNGIPCQDNCYYDSNDNIVVAAIADGLSSSRFSDVASQKAVEFVVKFCLKNITKQDSEDKIIAILKKSFDNALFAIKQVAKETPNDLNDYDTTLTVAVLIEGILYYGQIGDSGIVALLEDGRFERITEAQNGDGIGKDRPVYPLAAMSKWSFKKYEKKVKALFLATDGVLKTIQHPLLEGQQYYINHKYLAYIYSKINSLKDDKEIEKCIKNEVEELSPEEVDYDDKTLVVVINKKCNLKPQSSDYYNFPTDELWKKIQKKYETELYPYRNLEKKEIIEQNQKINMEQNDLNIEEVEASDHHNEKLSLKRKDDNTEEELTQNSLAKKTKIDAKKSKYKLISKKEQRVEIYILTVLIIILFVLLAILTYLFFNNPPF